jgi:V/A-type H+-transporting ATPase subunit E
VAAAESPGAGVQALIDRLQGEGVEAGRAAAARIEDEARRRAERLLEDAERRAVALVGEARREADAEREAVKHSLQLAYRDTLLALQEALVRELAARLEAMVAAHMGTTDGLEAVVVETLREATSQLGRLEGARLEASTSDGSAGDALLARIAARCLADGVTLEAAHGTPGVRLQLRDGRVELDLSAGAVAGMILERLHPRLRGFFAAPTSAP